MSDLTPAANRWLATHHGVITTKALRECGVGRSTADRLVAAGVLRAVHKWVLIATSSPTTLAQRCAAACAAHPAGFVTGPTAGMLLGLRRMPRTTSIHLSVRHGVHLPACLGVVLRQTTALHPRDRTVGADGVTTASWLRLAFDLAADLQPLDHLSVLHQLLEHGHVTSEQLAAIGRRLCHPGRRGSAVFRHSLERLDPSPPNASHPEVEVAEALRARGVPVEHQVPLTRPGSGRVARVDLGVPGARWGVELDIHPEHRTIEGHAGDARRYRDLHHLDWQIEPVSEADMVDVELLADDLALLYHTRARQLAVSRPSVS